MKRLLLSLLIPALAYNVYSQSVTLDSEWDTTAKINTATTDQDFIVQDGTVDLTLLNFTDATTLTASTGAVTATQVLHIIAAETGTADDIITISGGATGDILIVRPDSGDTLTFLDSDGNFDFAGQDVVLDSVNERLVLEYNGTNWVIVAVSPFVLGVSDIEVEGGLDGLADDTYDGFVIANKNAGETITQWDVVYLDGTSGEWMQADADAAGEFPARGIAVEAGTDGNALKVLVQGTIRNDGWTWTDEGVTLYLSDTVAGLTETAPSTSGDAVQILGYALSDDEIYFNAAGHYAEVE
jgi:hypothetical protein